jgi:hypothetical protein
MLTKRILKLYSYHCQITLYYTCFIASLFDWDYKKRRIKSTKGFTRFMFALWIVCLLIACIFMVSRMYIKVAWYQSMDPAALCINLIYFFGVAFFSLVFIELIRGGTDALVEFSRQTIKLDKMFHRKIIIKILEPTLLENRGNSIQVRSNKHLLNFIYIKERWVHI